MDFVIFPDKRLRIASEYVILNTVLDPEGTPLTADGAFPLAKPQSFCKGGGEMVTYENLFNFTLVIIETITLVVLIYKSNK